MPRIFIIVKTPQQLSQRLVSELISPRRGSVLVVDRRGPAQQPSRPRRLLGVCVCDNPGVPGGLLAGPPSTAPLNIFCRCRSHASEMAATENQTP